MSATVHATRNYQLFELCEFNRDVRKIEKLRASMKMHGWIKAYPMHVVRSTGGKLKIKGGHHRFCVAQELKIPAVYVISDDAATVVELEEATTPWAFRDYVNSYCRVGNPAYLAVKEFSDSTGIGLGQAASLLAGEGAGSNNQGKKIKSGKYRLEPNKHADEVARLVIICRGMGMAFATTRQFVSALSMALRVPEFRADAFLHRLAINRGLLGKQATVAQYLDAVERVYNYQSKQKIALAFLAKEEMRKRSAAMKQGG
jgi:hypothetical protein